MTAAHSPAATDHPTLVAADQGQGRAPAGTGRHRGGAAGHVPGNRPGSPNRPGPFTAAPSAAGGLGHRHSRAELKAARRGALVVDLGAVTASMAANVAAAPQTLGGWLVAILAPVGLFAAVYLWHRARGVVIGAAVWLFSVLLGLVALGAAVVSFDHVRTVAEAHGQGPLAAIILPLVVDVTAVLATIVVVSAGHRLTELDQAEAVEAQARVEAERQAELDAQQAADELAAAERQADADRAERERLAQLEAEREAATVERAHLDAEAEAARLAAAEAERAKLDAAEAAARRERLEARGAPVSAGNGSGFNGAARAASGQQGPGSPTRGADTAQAIADYLTEHPDATQADVAAAVGVTNKTVQRSAAWQDHRAARDETESSPDPAAEVAA